MRKGLTHPVVQFVILGITVMAFFLLAKLAVNYLPDGGPGGAVKKAVHAA